MRGVGAVVEVLSGGLEATEPGKLGAGDDGDGGRDGRGGGGGGEHGAVPPFGVIGRGEGVGLHGGLGGRAVRAAPGRSLAVEGAHAAGVAVGAVRQEVHAGLGGGGEVAGDEGGDRAAGAAVGDEHARGDGGAAIADGDLHAARSFVVAAVGARWAKRAG